MPLRNDTRVRVEGRRLRTLGPVGGCDDLGEPVALLPRHDHEAPWRELAVVRRARGDLDHRVQLIGIGARRDEVARLARAACGEE